MYCKRMNGKLHVFWVKLQKSILSALTAVGSSYTLMTFLTSIIIGLCLGSGSFLSMAFGRKDEFAIRNGIFMSFVLIGAMAIIIMGIVYGTLDLIISLLQVPEEIMDDMRNCIYIRQGTYDNFVGIENFDVINVGTTYLQIEGAFYLGIGILFLLYGYYRAVNKTGMSVILTIISLGTRVVLGYTLSRIPSLGEIGIWLAIPIG